MARLDYSARIKEYRARAGRGDITLRLEDDLACPYATLPKSGRGAVIVLPKPNPAWDDDKWIDWEFSAEHELGHLMPDVVDAYTVIHEKGLDMASFMGTCMNILEDHRQEHHKFNEYAGRKARLSKGRRKFWDTFDTSHMSNPASDDHRLAMETMMVWDNYIREEWMRSLSGTSDRLIDKLLPKQQEWLEKLVAGDYESTLKSGITAQREYELVKQIIDEVFPFDAEQEEQEATSNGKGNETGKGQGDSGSDTGESGDGEETEGSEKAGEGDQEGGNGEGEKGKRSAQGSVNYSDLLAHNHSEDEEGASYASLTINYDSSTGMFTPADPNDYITIDYENDDKPIVPNKRYRPYMDDSTGMGLAKHVRRLLQVRSQSTYQHGLKRGKISPKSIYRGGMQGAAQQKVFKKRIDNDMLNTAVGILVDMSGSMGGLGSDAKVVNAAISAKLLNDAIAAIGVPLEVCGFDDSSWRPRHSIIKSFGKTATSDEIFDRFADACSRQMSGNSDGESILWMFDRLTKRREKRKVLIVISDGQPAGGQGDAMWYTQKIVKGIEDSGAVDIFGLGLEDMSVKRIYKNWAVIRNASELERGLLTIIENKILNNS